MEFIYYPLAVIEGKERPGLPGGIVLSTPHGSHRHRRDDLLAVLLTLNGDHRYAAEELRELAETTANVFYATQGSVTRALQQSAEEVNKNILERNLDRGYEGIRAGGSINLSALHNGWLFICQYGSTNLVLISAEKYEEFGKTEGLSENLGQTKRIQPRFYQCEVKPGDLVLMNENLPYSWSSYYLAGSSALEMDQVKRRLLNQVTKDIEAIVIKIGEGAARVIRKNWQETIRTGISEKQVVVEEGSPKVNLTFPASQKSSKAMGTETDEGPEAESGDSTGAEISGVEIPVDQIEALDAVPVLRGETENLNSTNETIPDGPTAVKSPPSFLLKLARLWMNLKTFNSRLRLSYDRLRKKIFPKFQPQKESATSGLLVLLAVFLPVLLVFISLRSYSQIGKTEQYTSLMSEAQQIAEFANEEKDAVKQHAYWGQVIDLVKSAEKYEVTQDSRMLYEQAQFFLDEMDLATRLDFRPALTQFFPEGVIISHIQAGSSGVYLLDRTSGSIMRIYLNTKGFYEIDDEFSCAPGPYGLDVVDELMDFITLPANEDNYRIMAVDGKGSLLYCRPGEVPVSRSLAAPEGGWGRIAGVGYEGDILYVLDADKDAIWMYTGKNPNKPDVETASGIVFSDSPVGFLDKNEPDFGGGLDLVINQGDVYILHQDGHMTQCRLTSSQDARPAFCQDPAPFTDNRVGRDDRKPWIFSDAVFTMLQGIRLPNASIYVLDVSNPSLYQFSYQLNLERVLRPQYSRSYPLPDSPPTGFGVSPDMELFLAYGNKLFIAPLK